MLYEAESGDIQIAVTGDSIITRSMSVFREESFQKLVEVLHSGVEIIHHLHRHGERQKLLAPIVVNGR